MPIRKISVKPMPVGPYSHAIILPAWWLRMNANPKSLEMVLTLDVIEVRPVAEDAREPTENKDG